jgi:hypothetical protein
MQSNVHERKEEPKFSKFRFDQNYFSERLIPEVLWYFILKKILSAYLWWK